MASGCSIDVWHSCSNICLRSCKNIESSSQFLAGMPVSVSRQLCATTDITTVDKALERAQLLMAINAELQEPAKELCSAAVASTANNQQLQQFTKRVEELAYKWQR